MLRQLVQRRHLLSGEPNGTIRSVSTSLGDVRPLSLDDLDWVLDLGGQRRERIVSFAPRFWHPAPDARGRHEAFLNDQIRDLDVVTLRTDHGFVFATPRADLLDVDDMALDQDTRWPDDGTRLLRAVMEHHDLRFVCPVPEPSRSRTARYLGMSVKESWWHRNLAPTVVRVGTSDQVVVPGARGQLVEAPPVYAPGGPVLLVSEVASAAALAAIENAAAAVEAVVSVVLRSAGAPEDLLRRGGYTRTTDFFQWRR